LLMANSTVVANSSAGQEDVDRLASSLGDRSSRSSTPRSWRAPATTLPSQRLLAPLKLGSPRLPPKQRRAAEDRIQRHMRLRWLLSHSLVTVPQVEVSAQRRQTLLEAFSMLDADGSGSIGTAELSIAMKALGFKPDDIRKAIALGDHDGDGELSFEEFLALIAAAEPEGGRGSSGSGESFPFHLIANSYNISKLVDSYHPDRPKDSARERSSLPPVKPSAALAPRPSTTPTGGPYGLNNWRAPRRAAGSSPRGRSAPGSPRAKGSAWSTGSPAPPGSSP